ncbi:MAG: class I SAM-dependent rRNA methyltransferase [Opitutales bacterium]
MSEPLQLLPGHRPRVLQGHPWVYASELKDADRIPTPASGETRDLVDARGRPLGTGLVNPKSQIRWRRLDGAEPGQPLDSAFWQRSLERIPARRACEKPFQRLVFSDADGLPGLIIDRFEDLLVVQAQTLGVDLQLPAILAVLEERFSPTDIILRNDAPARKLEGLPRTTGTRSGNRCEPRWFTIDGIAYFLDLEEGQKTGFYLDQRQQHRRVAGLAEGRTVLDCFANQGAFALQALKAGATAATAIESSADCCVRMRANADRNGLNLEVVEANVFDWFTHNRDSRWDLIILDPPSFARNRKAVKGALRGYKELNLRALQMLNPGGVLATYSCSQHVDPATFAETVRDALGDAGRRARILDTTTQPPDHPQLLHFPESQYLNGLVLEVPGSRF